MRNPDILSNLTTVALLIAPAPFFWAPPLWVLALMTPVRRPVYRSGWLRLLRFIPEPDSSLRMRGSQELLPVR